MSKQSLIFTLQTHGLIKFGNYTLKSGEQSSIYVNLREVIAYPDLLKTVSDHIFAALPEQAKKELICGVPYSALTMATYLSTEHNIPMILRRKEAKAYGTKQQLEGVFKPGQSCVVIEDVVTTGNSILETVNDLRNAGMVVEHAAVLVNREQGAKQTLRDAGLQLHAVITLNEIMDAIGKPNDT